MSAIGQAVNSSTTTQRVINDASDVVTDATEEGIVGKAEIKKKDIENDVTTTAVKSATSAFDKFSF